MKSSFVKAGGILICGLALALAIEVGLNIVDSEVAGGFVSTLSSGKKDLVAAEDPVAGGGSASVASGVVMKVDTLSSAYGFEVPNEFNAEVVFVEEFSDVLVSSDGSIVGFSCEGEASSVFDRLAQNLIAKGWVQAESGQPLIGSFVKGQGTYSWLLLSCFDVGGAVSVVVQVK